MLWTRTRCGRQRTRNKNRAAEGAPGAHATFGLMIPRRGAWIAVIGSVAALAYQASDARRYFDQARQLFGQHQLQQAQAAAAKALAADPQMGDAETLMGLIASVQSQFAEAEKHFARAIALQPQNYQAHAYLGSTYLQQKRFAEAARAFNKVLELNPGNAAATYNLGLIALAQDSPTEALRHFETVARAAPSDIPALMGMLECQLLLRKTQESRDTAGRIAALVKDQDPRLLQIAALLAQHGESAAAIPLIERARLAFPQSYEVNYNLALACFQAGRYDRAAEVLRPFAGPDGKAEACNLLGAIEEKRGHMDDAEHAFEEATRRDRVSEDFRFDWGNALLQHGKLEPAVRAFRSAVSDLPKSWKLRVGLGSACYLSGDYEGAAEALLEAVRLKPDSVMACFLLGEAYDSAARFQPAIETALASYLKGAPRDPWAYYHLAAILYAHAQYDHALENLHQALRLDPNFAEAYLEIGLITLAQDKTGESIAALEKAVHLDPGLAAAHYRLGLAYQRTGNAARAKEELARFRALKDDARYRTRVLESLATMGR